MNQLAPTSARRQFLARLASTTLGVGLLPDDALFAAGAGASSARLADPKAKQVIYLYMAGGMSHLDTFDVKPGAEVMGPTRTIPTAVDDGFIGADLPRLAPLMDRFAVVNSMHSTQGAHEQGNYFMHTSYSLRGTIRHPALGAWLLRFQGKGNPTLPGNAVIGPSSRHPGAGFLDSRHAPLRISDPANGLRNSRRLDDVTEATFQRRLEMAHFLDTGFHRTYPQRQVRAYQELYDEALKLMKSADLEAFELAAEPEALRHDYGENPFGQGCLLARRLVQHGVRFVEVSLGRWDTHVDNFTGVPERCDLLDRALSTLVRDLEREGLLDSTLIVVATEFGRTPDINANEGRDHYPQAFTCLLAGGGIQGGTRVGATDERGAEVLSDRVSVPDFNATLAYALGLPLDEVVFSPSKRPFTIADKGQPLTSLFT